MRTRSRSVAVSLAALIGAGGTVTACTDDPISAPETPAAAAMPTLALSGPLTGADTTIVRALRSSWYDGGAPIRDARYFGSSTYTQVASKTTALDPFPREGPAYLVISSGRAASHTSGSYKSTAFGCSPDTPGLCDVGGLDIVLRVPDNGGKIGFDLVYFSWDANTRSDPFRVAVVDSVSTTVSDPTNCVEWDVATQTCTQYGTTVVKEPRVTLLREWTTAEEFPTKSIAGGLTYGAHHRVALDVSRFENRTVIIRFQAADAATTGFDSGALIDNFRFVPRSVSDWKGPIAYGTMAAPVPVAINTYYTLTTSLSDDDHGDSQIAGAEYFVNAGAWARMTLTSASGDGGTATKSLRHSSVNVYTVCARGVDEYGNLGRRECIEQAAYDPTKTYAAGSGWFKSLPPSEVGATYDDTNIPRAYFGVSARYKYRSDGTTTLQGAMRMQVKFKDAEVAHLSFRSKSLSYLLIDPSGLSRIKGRGVLYRNDKPQGNTSRGDYYFLASMIDGDAPKRTPGDRIRLKIWHVSTGQLVYDSQLGWSGNAYDDALYADTYEPLADVAAGGIRIQ